VADCANFLAPTVGLVTIAGILASFAQNPPRIIPDRVVPDWSRLSPGAGLRRIFGPRGWAELFKSVLKICAVAAVTTALLAGQKYLIVTALELDARALPERLIGLGVRVVAAILVATLVVAGIDLAWARILWRRDQRMSRHELKEELKEAEGDRLMKARLRSIRLDRSRKRMLAAIPRATMVVVNPTHYAVALRYVRSEGGAPMVVAKGVDLIALRIRSIAEELGIAVVEDRPLARSLHDAVTVDQAIPPEFYRAVAEVVHLIGRGKSAWPSPPERTVS
jgi:flagellar biosynthetic protein FlhB